MDISASLDHTIDGMRMLGDVITGLSTAGIGLVILTWSGMLGIHDDADLSDFRRPMLLVVPLATFIVAVLAGYCLSSSLSGFYFEVTARESTQGQAITSAETYFKSEFWKFNVIGQIQLFASVIGIVATSWWFLWNIRQKTRSKPS